MDLSNLARMAFLTAMVTNLVSARLLVEVPQLQTPPMPLSPADPTLASIPVFPVPDHQAAAAGGTGSLGQPLTFFIHSSASVSQQIPFGASNSGFPMASGGNKPGSNAPYLMAITGDLTEGPVMGSSYVIGKAEGFSMAMPRGEGMDQIVSCTTLFREGGYADSISFFGVLRTDAEARSDVAVVGGTGRYVNARGSATIQAVHGIEQGAHGGVEGMIPLMQVRVYLV